MKIYFVAPAFKLMETPAEVHRYAYWSLLGAPGINYTCTLNCILKIFLGNLKILILFLKI